MIGEKCSPEFLASSKTGTISSKCRAASRVGANHQIFLYSNITFELDLHLNIRLIMYIQRNIPRENIEIFEYHNPLAV